MGTGPAGGFSGRRFTLGNELFTNLVSAGAPAIAFRVRTAVLKGGSTTALDTGAGDSGTLTGFTVSEAVRAAEKLCTAVVKEVVRLPAPANVINPPKFVVPDPRLVRRGSGSGSERVPFGRKPALPGGGRRATGRVKRSRRRPHSQRGKPQAIEAIEWWLRVAENRGASSA